MEFINKIGQRKFAKILFGSSIVLALIGYVIRHFLDKSAGLNPSLFEFGMKTAIGLVLLTTSVGIFTIAAHKTKEFRMLAILISGLIILTNTVGFNLRMDLLYVTFGEIIASLLFLGFILKYESEKKESEKRLKYKSKSNSTSVEVKEIELTTEK